MLTPEQLVARVSNTQEDLTKIRKDLRRSDLIMAGIIVVLFIGFVGVSVTLGGIVVDSYRSKEATYQDLIDKINQQSENLGKQNDKIDILTTKTNTILYYTKPK